MELPSTISLLSLGKRGAILEDCKINYISFKSQTVYTSSGSRGGGGLGGLTPPPFRGVFVVACQYMKIPTDLDPNPPPPPLRRILAQNTPPPPPVKEFLDPPLYTCPGRRAHKTCKCRISTIKLTHRHISAESISACPGCSLLSRKSPLTPCWKCRCYAVCESPHTPRSL